jgi:hypothetical protein
MFWVASCVKECRLWEIKGDMQLNAQEPKSISMKRKNQGILVQTLAIDLHRQKNWVQRTEAFSANGSKHRCDVVGHLVSHCPLRISRVVIWRVFYLSSLSLSHKYLLFKSKTRNAFIKYNTV